jgi:arylsulfatase A-like enzyme
VTAGPRDLERLYRRGLLSRRQLIQGLAALGVSGSSLELLFGATAHAQTTAPVATAKYLVVITLDAFRPDYMNLAPMPALSALMRAGTSYDRAWVGQLESETPVSHATISTGALPKRQGVIGFEWRDPKTLEEVLDGWPPGVLAGKLAKDLHDAGVSSIPSLVKAARPKAVVVTASSEKVYAAGAMGGWAADYVLYHQRTGPGKTILTPSAVPGHAPPPEFFQHPGLKTVLPMKHFTDWDYLSTVLGLVAIDQFRPDVLMLNLPGADVYGHPYGGPAAPAIFRQIVGGIDRNIARIVQAYKTAGIFDQTLFVIAGDHGMVPNDRTVSGDDTRTAVAQAGGKYHFHTGGTAADIYLHNYWHARAVAMEMLKLPGVAAAYYQTRPKGRNEYVPAPGMSIDPSLDAAYRYLLDTIVGPTAPDVVAPFRENTIGTASTNAHGDHGGLNWGAQHVPLVFSGPGVTAGVVSEAPARLVDVAPTIVRLMGLPPAPMDGTVLADAVTAADAQEVATQASLSGTLTAYQDALIAQSLTNIAEDQRTRLNPPPPLPARP